MVNFKLFGYEPAMERKNKVLEVCRVKGWHFICMQPGRRYVIRVSWKEYYWTYDEVIREGGVENGSNSLDSMSPSGNRLLVDRSNDKVLVVRHPRNF
jgi:hypothetical protein